MNLAELTAEQVGEWLTLTSYREGYDHDGESEDEEDFEGIDYSAISELPFWKEVDTPIGMVKEVDSYGGEGQGEQYWMIISIVQGDVIRTFKLDGWYASYDGGYYDEFYEVFPELKTITVWERK